MANKMDKYAKYNPEDYRFKRPVNRLGSLYKIPGVFNNKKPRYMANERYFGRIGKIDAMVEFHTNLPCMVGVKEQDRLDEVHKTIIDRLINPGK